MRENIFALSEMEMAASPTNAGLLKMKTIGCEIWSARILASRKKNAFAIEVDETKLGFLEEEKNDYRVCYGDGGILNLQSWFCFISLKYEGWFSRVAFQTWRADEILAKMRSRKNGMRNEWSGRYSNFRRSRLLTFFFKLSFLLRFGKNVRFKLEMPINCWYTDLEFDISPMIKQIKSRQSQFYLLVKERSFCS